MSKVFEPCFKCGNEALTDNGVIYVRAEIKGKWGNHIICYACWKKHYRKDRDGELTMSAERANELGMGRTYDETGFRADIDILLQKEMIVENPINDYHLTAKGRFVAEQIIKYPKSKRISELSIMQIKMLEALYNGD